MSLLLLFQYDISINGLTNADNYDLLISKLKVVLMVGQLCISEAICKKYFTKSR